MTTKIMQYLPNNNNNKVTITQLMNITIAIIIDNNVDLCHDIHVNCDYYNSFHDLFTQQHDIVQCRSHHLHDGDNEQGEKQQDKHHQNDKHVHE